MVDKTALLSDDSPKYKRIKDYILGKISQGELKAHDRLPSETELSKELGFSIITVRKAYSELVNEGAIYRVKGKGSFVADQDKSEKSGIDVYKKLVVLMLSCDEAYDSSLMQMTKGIQSYLKKHDYSLIIEHSNRDVEKEKEIIQSVAEKRIGGMILFSENPEACQQEILKLKENKVPFVMVDRYISTFPVSYVASDNFDGAYSAAMHLIELGHKNIAFLASNFFLSSEKERYQGYLKALEYANITFKPEWLIKEPVTKNSKLFPMIKNGEITAIMAVNDMLAIELMNICESNKIKVPEDVSIIGFDDIEKAKYQRISLSTVKQYFNKIGYEAARILVRSISDQDLGCCKVLLPVKVIARDSTSYTKS